MNKQPQVLSILILLCLSLSCTKQNKLLTISDKREQFIVRLLDTLHTADKQCNRFLVISKYSCPKCVQSILDTVAKTTIRDSLIVVNIGEDSEYVVRMNYLYFRQHIRFAVAHPALLDSLLQQDQFFAINLVCGAKKRGKSYQIFDGLKHTKNTVPEAV